MDKDVRAVKITGTGSHNKVVVVGLMQRDGEVRASVAPTPRGASCRLASRTTSSTGSASKPFHLFRYLDERLVPYNLPELSDYGRFAFLPQGAAGCQLTYAELTGKA